MNDQNSSNLNWKTAVVVGAIAITTSVGVYYYLHSRKKLKSTKSLDIDDTDISILQPVTEEIESDPRLQSVKIKEKGNSYFKAGRYEMAKDCYTEALSLCPLNFKQDKAILYQNRAVALENMKKLDESLLDLNEALSLHPRYEKALIRRSRIYQEQKRYRDALIDITAAAIFNKFKMGDLMNRMEQIVKDIAKTEVENELIGTPILQSDLYIKTYFESFPSDPFLNDMSQQSDLMDRSGDSNHSDGVQHVMDLLKSDRYEESFQFVQTILNNKSEAIFSEEEKSRLHLLRGTFYLLSCRENLALIDFDMVITNSYARPSVTINALIKKAMIMLANENQKGAENSFIEALQIDPDCADIYYHRGSFFESIERIQEAINDYSRALELNPDYSYAAAHKILNEFRLNAVMIDQFSVEKFKQLVKKFPSCIECNIIFAQVLLSENKFDEAEKVCEDLLGLRSKSSTIVTTLAMIKLSQNKLSDAKKLLNETIKDDPKCSYSYNTLASVYIKDGDLQKALELLNFAVKYARNRQELNNFIATREGVHAQLIVSANYNIPPKDIFAAILQGLEMPAFV